MLASCPFTEMRGQQLPNSIICDKVISSTKSATVAVYRHGCNSRIYLCPDGGGKDHMEDFAVAPGAGFVQRQSDAQWRCNSAGSGYGPADSRSYLRQLARNAQPTQARPCRPAHADMLKRDCGLRDCGRGGWLSIQSKVIGERLLRSGRADLRREQAGLRGSQTFSCSELTPLARRRSRPEEVCAGRGLGWKAEGASGTEPVQGLPMGREM